MFYLWVLIIILLIVAEVLTINLLTIWYIASGIITLVLSFFIDNFIIQFAVFVILGTILLITTRPILNKLLKGKIEKTNFDRIIGMKGIVVERINKNSYGAVKVDGKIWTAYSDSIINVDTTVKVLEINSTKIKVEICD